MSFRKAITRVCQSLLFAAPKTATARTRNRVSLALQNLDHRICPTVDITAGSTLVLTSTNASDTVIISRPVGSTQLATVSVNVNGVFVRQFSGVDKIRFFGNDGDDKITNNTGIRLEAFGGDGDDVLIGGTAGDSLNGEIGNDTLTGNAGKDFLDGGDNDDDLFGGAGDDQIHGGAGNDELHGNDGLDSLFGEAGNDDLDGGADMYGDVLIGGTGQDDFKYDANYLFFFVNQQVIDLNASEGDRMV